MHSDTPLMYDIDAYAFGLSWGFGCALFAFRSLIMRRSSLHLRAVVHGIPLARSSKVLTTVLLLCTGLCEWKSKYLLICVAL